MLQLSDGAKTYLSQSAGSVPDSWFRLAENERRLDMPLSGGMVELKTFELRSTNSMAVSEGSQVSIEPVTAHIGMTSQDRCSTTCLAQQPASISLTLVATAIQIH